MVLVHEEASKEHERNDEYRSQGHGELLVREKRTENQRIASRCVVNQEENQKEDWELVPFVSVEANQKVANATKESRSQNTGRQLRIYLRPEVSAHRIHVVVGFSKEDWPLIREDKDDVLDSIEAHRHSNEEEGSISVLDSSLIALYVIEENNTEKSSQSSNDSLNVRCLWKPDNVEEVSACK